MENCGSTENLNVPKVRSVPKKASETTSALASRFKALLSRPRTSARTFTGTAPPKVKQELRADKTLHSVSVKKIIAPTKSTQDTKKSEAGINAVSRGLCISTTVVSAEAPEKSTKAPVLATCQRSITVASQKITKDSTTLKLPSSVDVASKNDHSSVITVPTANVEDSASIYVYTKQQVNEKVKCAIQEFTKEFREEEDTLQVLSNVFSFFAY